jgi:hypothetical protein
MSPQICQIFLKDKKSHFEMLIIVRIRACLLNALRTHFQLLMKFLKISCLAMNYKFTEQFTADLKWFVIQLFIQIFCLFKNHSSSKYSL